MFVEKTFKEYSVTFGFDQFTNRNEATVALNALGLVWRNKIIDKPEDKTVEDLIATPSPKIRTSIENAMNTQDVRNMPKVFMPDVEQYALTVALDEKDLQFLRGALEFYKNESVASVTVHTPMQEAMTAGLDSYVAGEMVKELEEANISSVDVSPRVKHDVGF